MTHEQYVYWLQGMAEIISAQPTRAQWARITYCLADTVRMAASTAACCNEEQVKVNRDFKFVPDSPDFMREIQASAPIRPYGQVS